MVYVFTGSRASVGLASSAVALDYVLSKVAPPRGVFTPVACIPIVRHG